MTSLPQEPGQKTTLSLWVKIPIIMVVAFALILMKKTLQGLVTFFPMVGVIGAYEARGCLGAICHRMPMFIFLMLPMLITCKLLQHQYGLQTALLRSWSVFLVLLIPVNTYWRRRELHDLAREDDQKRVAGHFPAS
jgi:hypothetical protein